MSSNTQAVIITLNNNGLPPEVYEEYDLCTLEDEIEDVLGDAGVLDGHEFGPEAAQIFLYGPDAEAIFRLIEPVVKAYPLCAKGSVEIRPGDENTESRIVQLP
ncbi:hypothetical protein B0W47_02240 [Komagataeibacter nataicola]|uniref:Uncharacterized protein n=1 Tax=Komagataeibacter nataicola TaxID=265960 RepID=A0A9N7CF84_9PROT|nr:hypothetical protein [Komagataeibacter nataicola]AQU86465.1 hypothetical protein B0W47_02240 [Komagataeibacter nataicola]PYD65850.1 hypothetical protein CDI09_11305 [Komagataeibacter nataicola]WEQ56640.1 hypothetical protein LV564_06065 [Komagataeibacter nataicola]WNM08112.1 hypothetical protein RI056_14510 [Komagataeibacter nataicola]GBR19576.1 hypothetical protein AA0616_1574 [Komagataeibacter nataicola NRIC 0616]